MTATTPAPQQHCQTAHSPQPHTTALQVPAPLATPALALTPAATEHGHKAVIRAVPLVPMPQLQHH